MQRERPDIPHVLSALEQSYGSQHATWPTDPYEFLLWWQCGYPASDASCAKGWKILTEHVGIEPKRIVEAGFGKLAHALKPGGLFPELRAERLLLIAASVLNEFGGDLKHGLQGPIPAVRKALKKFPSIGDPGVDRILLFGGISPVPAIPSNCPHVLVRIAYGPEGENYGATYRKAQELIEHTIPATLDARQRAYLISKCHGQNLCKGSRPRCAECPVQTECAYGAGKSAFRSGNDPPDI